MINKQFWIRFSTLCLALIFVFGTFDLDAQNRKRKKKKKKKKDDTEIAFKDHLWYGGGVNLGFNGGNGQSSFTFGLSPMVGYKVNKFLSAGPRLGLNYQYFKTPVGTGLFASGNFFTIEPGLFARGKLFQGIYLHAEQTFAYEQQWNGSLSPNGKLETTWNSNPYTYLGAGLNQSQGGFGYDVTLLYNVTVAGDPSSPRNPFEFRGGFTYNF